MTDCLVLDRVSKSYSGFLLRDVSFSLPKGYIMGLIGPNGAGKTTTIQLILNMTESDSGNISVFGMDNIECEKAIKQDIGTVFDSVFYVKDWTTLDAGRANSLFFDNWNTSEFKELLLRFRLPSNKKVKDLSRGMQMKLMLACAFSHNAKLLILDEPTSGLDPVIRSELLELLQEYISDGERSVLFSSHITTDLEQIADYVTYLNNGQVVYTGSMEDFKENYRVIKGNTNLLTDELEKLIIGLRKTEVGFEGLIKINLVEQFSDFLFEPATVHDIVVFTSKDNQHG